ncbi:MAG: peptidoglycan recognition family protein [Candidatus Nanoarchaeia archaeon]|nr:peptidoglycan recognition family protein [Candidatus Nanoarchaeia archaeon]
MKEKKVIIPEYEIDISDALDFKYLIVHHSATVDGKLFDWGAIDQYHRSLGWVCVGYNFGIERIGGKLVFHTGRPLNIAGAHTKEQNMNTLSIGCLFVGNFDLVPPDDEMIYFSVPFISAYLKAFNIPIENVFPHNHWATYKSCPGSKFPFQRLTELLDIELKHQDLRSQLGYD